MATFFVGDALCGMDILNIQEINKLMDMTKVPQAPSYVIGILNLRGQIVTIIDLGKKLGLGATEATPISRNIIVNSPGEHVGLLVSQLSDVVSADTDRIERAPANMGGIQGNFFPESIRPRINSLASLILIKSYDLKTRGTDNASKEVARISGGRHHCLPKGGQ